MLVACSLPADALAALRDAFEVETIDNPEYPDAGRVAASARDKDVVLLSVTLPLTAGLVASLPASVTRVATYSVGYDHIDLAACRDRGIRVFNTPDVLTDAVAEAALLLLLGTARRAREASALILEGRWRGWQPTQINGVGLAGKSLGIFGMGRIGRAIAERARAFGMEIHYSNRRRLPPPLEGSAVFHASADAMLGASDVLVLACPANEGTRNFLDESRLRLLPRGAIVVNISRGNVVDDDALIGALRSGHIRGAGLDVFNGEPNFDRRYLDLPNVFMLPHIGSSTIEARVRMAEILRDGLLADARGEPAPNLVNP